MTKRELRYHEAKAYVKYRRRNKFFFLPIEVFRKVRRTFRWKTRNDYPTIIFLHGQGKQGELLHTDDTLPSLTFTPCLK